MNDSMYYELVEFLNQSEQGKLLLAEFDKRYETIPEDLMIKVGGSSTSFRCEVCGSNVFRQLVINPKKVSCNGCQTIYLTEK